MLLVLTMAVAAVPMFVVMVHAQAPILAHGYAHYVGCSVLLPDGQRVGYSYDVPECDGELPERVSGSRAHFRIRGRYNQKPTGEQL
jgi:hypothetical protein